MAIQIDGDTGISGVNGSATTPALQGTDSNTGIVFGTDTVQIATGGSTRATVDSSGRVLVGTTTPGISGAEQLTVESSASGGITIRTATNGNGSLFFSDATSGDAEYDGYVQYEQANQALTFGTDSTERTRIDSSGRLLIGTTAAREHLNDGSDSAQVFVQGTTQNTSTLAVIRSSDNDGPSHIVLGKARGTGQSSTTIVQDGDTIGSINFEGADGSHLIRAAQISCVVDGTPGANDMPGRLKFSVTADGSNSLTERMRIGQNGQISTIYSSGIGIRIGSTASAGTNNLIQGGHSASNISNMSTSFIVSNNGNVTNTNNSYGAISDAKLKENIVDASSQWDDIKDLRVRNYNFIEGQTHTQIGVVAQEVETVSPGLVSESPDRDEEGNDLGTVTKSVNYSVLYMKAVKALQEAQTRIETLETQHADLLARVTALEAA
ncbi:MAG: hypothetical protein CMK96_16480 [Pseudomonas sp.]|jgi:hypothetical protein|nr:hypothetical protein [Pseudomonas sp.]